MSLEFVVVVYTVVVWERVQSTETPDTEGGGRHSMGRPTRNT